MSRLIGILVPIVVVALAVDRWAPSGTLSLTPRGSASDACLIKGNISYNTGEAIYHVPGGEWYDETIIDERYGERWFCSEEEARAAGWRRSWR